MYCFAKLDFVRAVWRVLEVSGNIFLTYTSDLDVRTVRIVEGYVSQPTSTVRMTSISYMYMSHVSTRQYCNEKPCFPLINCLLIKSWHMGVQLLSEDNTPYHNTAWFESFFTSLLRLWQRSSDTHWQRRSNTQSLNHQNKLVLLSTWDGGGM